MKNIGLIFLFLFSISCSQNSSHHDVDVNSDSAIIGGQSVKKGDSRFKSTVGIIMVDDRSGKSLGICSGTIISQNVVLTAAHCVLVSNDKVNFIIYFGNELLDLTQFNSYRAGQFAVTHENYDGGLTKNFYDIALIKFDGGLPPGYEPVSILKDSQYLKDGTELLVAGFGRNTRYGNSARNGSGRLRHVKLKISDLNFSDIEFRSSSWEKGICQGDSGGPAYVEIDGQLYVAGISNRVFGIGRLNCIHTSVFLRVDKLQSWIEKQLSSI